jgi:hypothetical protein
MSSMNFPTSPSDGDAYRKWEYDAATSSWVLVGGGGSSSGGGDLLVSYGSSAPVSVGVTIGDEFFITSDGTAAGDVSDAYIWNGSTWTAAQSTTFDGSVSGSDF